MNQKHQSLAGKELPDGMYDGQGQLHRTNQNSAPNYLKTEDEIISFAKELDTARKEFFTWKFSPENFSSKLNYLVRKMNKAEASLVHCIQCSDPSIWKEKMWRKVGKVYFGFYRCSDGEWMAYVGAKRMYSDWECLYGDYPPRPLIKENI